MCIRDRLLRDRGIVIGQEVIAQGVPLPAEAGFLAERLQVLSGLEWQGGAAVLPGAPPNELIELLCHVSGTWGALLQPRGFRSVGHWLVVDGLSPRSDVLVRDPVGFAYGIPIADFMEAWRYTVVVRELRS